MKMNKRALALATSVMIGGGVLSACGGGNGGSSGSRESGDKGVVTLPRIQPAVNARYQLVLLDAATAQRITQPLSVSFVGDVPLKAADGTTLSGRTITTSTGLVPVEAIFNASATEFSIQVEDKAGNGWIASGVRIIGEAGMTGDRTVELKLVNTNRAAEINQSPLPITMAVGSAEAQNGVLTAAKTVETQPSKTVTNAEGQTETMGVALITLDAGTRGTTADGQPAATGPLKVSSTYYGNANVDSLIAFPGGFAASVDPKGNSSVLNGATSNTGTFITAGFAQFNVTDSQGRPIKKFLDKEVTLGIDLPKTTKKLDGTVVAAGETFPIWSYDDAKGIWVFEKDGLVQDLGRPDNYTVTFQTNHLSTWQAGQYTPSCTTQINLNGRPAGDARSLRVDVIGEKGQRYAHRAVLSDSSLQIKQAPETPVSIKVFDGNEEVGRAVDQRLCAGNASVTVEVSLSSPPPVGSVQVNVSESCQDGSGKRALPTYVQLYTSNTWKSKYTENVSDTVSRATFTAVPAGRMEVEVGAYNARAKSYEFRPVTVNANGVARVDFNFPMTCPTGATGGGSGSF